MLEVLLSFVLFWISTLTILPLGLLLFKEIEDIIKHRNLNGLSETRKVLFVVTLGLFIYNLFDLIAVLHVALVGSVYTDWRQKAIIIDVLAKLFMTYAVWKFYFLVYNNNHHGKKN